MLVEDLPEQFGQVSDQLGVGLGAEPLVGGGN